MFLRIKLRHNIQGLNKKYRHWAQKAEVVKSQRLDAAVAMSNLLASGKLFECPVFYFRLVRYGKKLLDRLNLVGGFKAIQDGICDAVGIDDSNTEQLKWSYEQVKSKKIYMEIYVYDKIELWEMDKTSESVADKCV